MDRGRSATDASATATHYAYSVTGEPKGGWSSSAPAFRYTGQVAIASAAIYYYKARMYDPALGRFLQTDPVGYQAGMNLYAYVGNDSMNATDASGLCADPENSTVDCTDQVESVTDTGIRSWNDTLLTDLARITDRAQSPIFRFSIDEKQRQSIANGTNRFTINRGRPPGAQVCSVYGGAVTFLAPPGFNLGQITQAGQAGGLSFNAANTAVGHYGTYDFQRSRDAAGNTTYYTQYQIVSNVSAGAYMYGTGLPEILANGIEDIFNNSMSSNAMAPGQIGGQEIGWDAAAGNTSISCRR
jgi:RHS repeat-associated protein